MRSIGRALTWEFWRLYQGGFLAIFSYSVLFLFWLWYKFPHVDENAPEHMEAIARTYRFYLYFALFSCGAFLLSGFVDKRKRLVFSARHYVLPVRTSVLVAWQMVSTTIFMSLMVLVMVGCCRLCTGFSFPVLVPALFCSAVLVWTTAGLWFLVGSQVLTLLFFAVVPILLIWGCGGVFFTETWRSEMGTLGKGPLPVLILLFLLSLLAAYLIAVAGAARDRRGDAFSLLPIWEWLLERLGTLWVRQKRFSSPAAAQFWFEWRQKGLVMPIIAAAVHAGILVLILAGVIVNGAVDMVLGISCVFLSLAWFPMGFLFGLRDTSSGKWELGAFAGTRPLNDRDISLATLKVGAASIAATFAVCVLAVLPWVVMGSLEHLSGKFTAHPYLLAFGYLCGLLLSGWTVMALAACITLTGHKWVLGVLGAIVFVFFFGIMTLGTWNPMSPGRREALLETLVIFITSGCLLGAFAAFTAAYRKRLIGKGLVSLSACLWLLFVVCAVGLWLRFREPSEPMFFPLFLLIVLTALPVAPLALAPLALSWNRHR